MTFIYELDSYPLEIYRMYKCELSTWRLSKVIVWQTNRQTDRQTNRQTDKQTDIPETVTSWVVNKPPQTRKVWYTWTLIKCNTLPGYWAQILANDKQYSVVEVLLLFWRPSRLKSQYTNAYRAFSWLYATARYQLVYGVSIRKYSWYTSADKERLFHTKFAPLLVKRSLQLWSWVISPLVPAQVLRFVAGLQPRRHRQYACRMKEYMWCFTECTIPRCF